MTRKEMDRGDTPGITLRPVDLTTMDCLENKLLAFLAALLKVNS